MPSQQEVRWSQLKVGVIVLVSAVILTTLLFLMTSTSGLGFLSRKLTVTTYFENAAGLKVGAPVTLQGVVIGTVKGVGVSTAPERKLTPVQVTMKINGKYQSALHKDSTASLNTQGVLGDMEVDINSQVATGPMLRDGDELKTLETPSIQDVVKESQGTIENLNVILAKLNEVVDNLQSGKGSFGQLLTNPDLYNKLDAAADNFNKLTVTATSNENSIGKLLNDKGATYDKIEDMVGKLDAIASDAQAGKGSIGKALKDEKLYDNVNESAKNLNLLLADAQAGKGTAGMLLKDPAFARQASDSLTQIDNLLKGINEGKGSLGKWVTDDTTGANLNKLLTNGNDLVTAIRQDPKKYLTIHMKIF